MPSTRPRELALAAVLLAVTIAAVQFRMDDPWADGTLLVVALAPALLAGAAAFGFAPPLPPAGSVVVIAFLTLAAIAWLRMGLLVEDDPYEGGGLRTLLLAAFVLTAVAVARRTGSGIGLLIAVVAVVATVVSLAAWVGDDDSETLFRSVLLAAFVVLMAVGWTTERDRGGLLVAAAGITLVAYALFSTSLFFFIAGGSGLGWGWQAALGLGALALGAYAATEHARGPGYLAFFTLLAFAASVGFPVFSDDGATAATLRGWPIALTVLTLAAVAAALRPARA